MRFGKRITLFSISWCNGKAKIRLNHRLRIVSADVVIDRFA